MFTPNFSGFHSVNTLGRISRSRRRRGSYLTDDLTDNEQDGKISPVPVKLECDIENPDEVYMNAVYLAMIMIFAIGAFLIVAQR